MSKLLEAAQAVLNEALDAGYYGPGVNIEDADYNKDDWEGYHIDADGDLWYDIFHDLDMAIEKEMYKK
jgi:hypothetical protein